MQFFSDSCIVTIGILQVVTSLADPSANIIFGAVVDERFNGEIHVTIIATGFTQSFQKSLVSDPRGGAKLPDKTTASLDSTRSPPVTPLKPSSRIPTRKLFF